LKVFNSIFGGERKLYYIIRRIQCASHDSYEMSLYVAYSVTI
jgi:hypothetical protein